MARSCLWVVRGQTGQHRVRSFLRSVVGLKASLETSRTLASENATVCVGASYYPTMAFSFLSLLFGKGACFVEDPDYVHNGYTFDAGGGDYAMLLCRILDGNVDERTSDSSIKHPAVGHHSVRGAVRGNQYAYILYEHYRSYPRVPLFVWRGRTWLHTKSES